MKHISFITRYQDPKTRARVGEIHTPHGVIHTPAFIPVGTQATVKSLTPDDIRQVGTEIFFVNTYHVYLRPGTEIVKKCGGLHQFMGWDKPLITDSGGFQVFSLGNKKFVNIGLSETAVGDRKSFQKQLKSNPKSIPKEYTPAGNLVKIDDDVVTFQSHWDGSLHRFTPEKSITIQHDLGADIILCFDDCTPYPVTKKQARLSMERTHRWAKQSLIEHQRLKQNTKSTQSLYGIIQGSVFKDFREESARYISQMPFDGFAIGGVSVGESKKQMQEVCDWVVPLLPDEKPRHLLGVGEIDDVFTIVERGIDTFDCVQATRLARMGLLFSSKCKMQSSKLKTNSKFAIDITKRMFEKDLGLIDRECTCYTCQNFSRAYVHHLFRVRELLAYHLATIHNVHYMHQLMRAIRESLLEGTYAQLKKRYV